MSTPIVVLAGQSNAARAGTRIGVGEVAALNGALYVPFAVSGTPLAEEIDGGQGDWSASGAPGAGEHLLRLYSILDNYFDPASPNYIPDAYLAGVVWIQGEADGFYTDAIDQYVGNLVELRDAMVARYGNHDWVISALSEIAWDTRDAPTRVYDNYMQLRANQLSMASIDGFSVVDPDDVARALGISSADMFDPDRVHYPEDFGRLLGHALGEKLAIQYGGVRLQVGTSGNDYFNVVGNYTHEVFGSTGLNSVDFSAIGQGIRLDDHGERFASVRGIGAATGFSAELVEIGRVYGTDFADEFRLGTYLRDIRAGGGNDKVYAGTISINVQMGDGADIVYGSAFDDNIIGQNGADNLQGRDGSDRLFGGADVDKLYGGNGSDLIDGGDGNDQLYGGAGADDMFGGKGDDRYDVDHLGDSVTESAGQGRDRVISSVSFTLGANLEQLDLRDGFGELDATGNELANRLFGNSASNVIIGLAADDQLYGQGGDDQLFGGGGRDKLTGGGGADIMDGGLGNDTYYVDSARDVIVEDVGGGTDFVESNVSYVLADNVERLRVGRNGADVNGTGNEAANRLYGGNGDNVLLGLGGNDMLYGYGGNDVLRGGDGSDRLYGGNGDDMLYGGNGADRLNGGAGADMFVFGAADKSQTIDDFQQGIDLVTVSGVSFDDMTVRARGNGVQATFDAQHVIYFANTGLITLTHDDFVFV